MYIDTTLYISMAGWWFQPLWKYESQLGSLCHCSQSDLWKNRKHLPNHQPSYIYIYIIIYIINNEIIRQQNYLPSVCQLVVSNPLKNISKLGWLFQTTNQVGYIPSGWSRLTLQKIPLTYNWGYYLLMIHQVWYGIPHHSSCWTQHVSTVQSRNHENFSQSSSDVPHFSTQKILHPLKKNMPAWLLLFQLNGL